MTLRSIGEESYSAGSRPPLTDEPTFCVDPIGISTYSRRVFGLMDYELNRRDDEFHSWLSICVHLTGADLQAQTDPGCYLQPFPRPDGIYVILWHTGLFILKYTVHWHQGPRVLLAARYKCAAQEVAPSKSTEAFAFTQSSSPW